jgi:hypothetical protein
MITEQQLREIERDWQHHPDITDVSDLIAELRLVKQQLHEAEERAAGDDVTFKRLLDERTEADRQRDATLGTYAEAEKRWKTIIAARDREQALYVQANHDFRDALTEAHRVLREVEWSNGDFCPICTGLHPKGHRSGCALAAVLAQDTHA